MARLFQTVVLVVGHLLLAGLLLGALWCLALPRAGAPQFYLARAGAGLALGLLAWVAALLGRHLRQRRWARAGALAALAAADGLAFGGGLLLMATTGALPGPG